MAGSAGGSARATLTSPDCPTTAVSRVAGCGGAADAGGAVVLAANASPAGFLVEKALTGASGAPASAASAAPAADSGFATLGATAEPAVFGSIAGAGGATAMAELAGAAGCAAGGEACSVACAARAEFAARRFVFSAMARVESQ